MYGGNAIHVDIFSNIYCFCLGGGAILLSKIRQDEKISSHSRIPALLVIFVIGINFILWFVLKGSSFWMPVLDALGLHFGVEISFQSVELVASLGMGYYTLQIIGYVLDCYWETIDPQKNIFKLFLFVVFFPQLITGPISRYGQLKSIYERHDFSYMNITHGAQRILWGFFKKIVLAERVAIIVNSIWADPSVFCGLYTWVALLLYPIQMYADFSGCMDIVIGTAEMFDIKLAENFNNPFFSKTSQEFWQRWHITLGGWAKDYVLYPVLKSKVVLGVGKVSKKKFGKKAGKYISTAVGMFVLWMIMGIWHGAFKYIIGVSLWYWIILMLGEVAGPFFLKIAVKLGIRMENFSWRLFQSIRTYFIYAVGAVFFRADSIGDAVIFIKSLLAAFLAENRNPWIFFDGSVLNTGITHLDLNIITISVLLLLIVAVLREKYSYARLWMDQQSLPFRWLVWIGLFLFILVYGMYGPGHSAAEFIYQGF